MHITTRNLQQELGKIKQEDRSFKMALNFNIPAVLAVSVHTIIGHFVSVSIHFLKVIDEALVNVMFLLVRILLNFSFSGSTYLEFTKNWDP